MSNLFKSMCATKANVLDEITVNPIQANLITYRISKLLKVKTPTVVFVNKFLRRKNGDYNRVTNLIRLFVGGQNLHTLLHELSHTVEYHHKQSFWYQLLRVIEMWETEVSKDKEVKAAFAPVKKEKQMAVSKRFKYAVEILEGEILNNTLKMAIVGKTLADEGINNRENILKIQKIFKKKGIMVTR